MIDEPQAASGAIWDEKRLESFRREIERARKRRTQVKDTYDWDGNLERYVPLPSIDPAGNRSYDVNVGADFRDVERKKAALFYDTPAVSFIPDDPSLPVVPPQPPAPGQQPQQPQQQPLTYGSLAALHGRLINGLLGHKYANAKRVVHKALFDVLCPAGFGLVKVGYDVATVEVEQPVVDPMTGQPALNPITGQPEMQVMPQPVHEEWYLARISPYADLVPADHRDTDTDLAPWIGFDFVLPVSEARRRFGLPDDWTPTRQEGSAEDRPFFKDEELEADRDEGEPQVCGSYIEYRPAMLAQAGDPPFHPKQIFELVLIDGEKEPVVHRPSPHQTIGDDARLTPDSIEDFTIRRLTLRDRTDQPYVPSDCTVTAPLTKELNTYRTVIVRSRDANIPITLFDSEKFNPEMRDKFQSARRMADVGALVPAEAGALEGGPERIMAQVGMVSQGRENWTGQDYIERDREQILGIGANQAGAQNKTSRTATEVSAAQRNSEARFNQEQQRVLEWYLDLVCLFDAMVLRYADQRTAAKILGPQAAQVWAQHKQYLAGSYRYEIQIDSGKYQDVEAAKRQWLQLLNMVGQSQHVNVVPILEKLVQSYGLDPAQVVIQQPPKKGPEPPKVSITIAAEQFNPALPQFPIIMELARQGGYQISPQAEQEAKEQATRQAQIVGTLGASSDTAVPPEPPQITETLPKTPTLNQHQMDESGQQPGPSVN